MRKRSQLQDEIEAYAIHALAANGFGDAAIDRTEQHPRLDSGQLYLRARAHRSRWLAQMADAMLQFVGDFVRRMVARRKRRALAKATYRMLSGLDARTLRDLGFDRSEIPSVAAEIAGDADPTRVRSRPARFGHRALFQRNFRGEISPCKQSHSKQTLRPNRRRTVMQGA